MRKLQRNIALIAVLCLWSASGPLMALAQSGIATNQPIIIQLKQPALFDYRRQAFPQADGGLRPLAQAEQKSLLAYQSQIQSTQDQLIRDLNARGLSLKVSYRYMRLFNGVAVLAPGNRIKEILKLPGVKAVYPDHPVQATLEQSVPLVGAPTVWAMTDSLGRAVRGQGVIVAIVDTGIDYTHPDLGGCFGPGCRVVAGYDVSNDDADPMDDHSHGTHVAGIVGANGTVVGVAPEVTFYAFKVLNASGSGSDSTVIAGIERAMDPDQNPTTDDAADVINLSLGGAGDPDDAISQAVDAAFNAGAVVVVAAGNSGNYFAIGSPGTARQALTVGATDKADAMASFSSRGPVTQGWLLKPEIAAPGVSIHSTVLNHAYDWKSGTSMATPHVAGGAALLRQLHPTWTSGQVKAALINNALDLGQNVVTQGAGRMRLAPAAMAWAIAEPGILSLGVDLLSQNTWSAAQSFLLTNMSQASAIYTLTIASGVPTAVQPALSTSSLTLDPGASGMVTLTVNVSNTALTPPGAPTYTVEGKVLIQSAAGGDPLRVPFGFGTQQGADAYEPDNTAAQAQPITVDNVHQTHNFHELGDHDWVSFTAAAGGTYTIETGNLGPDCDTVLYLYASDGATQLAIDDDNGGEPLASRIDWTAPADGTYFVRAQQYGDSQSGDGTSYDLWVTGPQYIELLLGWNLIGFAGRKETAITTALVEIAGKYDEVLTYDAADAADPWKRYLPGTPAGLNEFTALQPGRGYWISMTAEGRLTINP